MTETKPIALTVVSFGAGQDTIYFVHRLLNDQTFYDRHVKGDLVIVGSDTGNEHPHTYQAIHHIKELCNGRFGFFWLTPDMGFHPITWQSLTYQYKLNSRCGSAAFPQTCTDNLKVKVVDNFVEWYIGRMYLNIELPQFVNRKYVGSNKKNYHQFYENHGKIRLILGFADQEESRTKNGNKFDPVWKKKVIERYYPLIEDKTDRQQAIDYNEANIEMKIFPSNCMICFYSSDQEILWLYRNYPQVFYEWVDIEKKKLEKSADKEKNYGVYGKITLQQKLEKAEKLYGHWSDDQLTEYKYSHGHCIKSRY